MQMLWMVWVCVGCLTQASSFNAWSKNAAKSCEDVLNEGELDVGHSASPKHNALLHDEVVQSWISLKRRAGWVKMIPCQRRTHATAKITSKNGLKSAFIKLLDKRRSNMLAMQLFAFSPQVIGRPLSLTRMVSMSSETDTLFRVFAYGDSLTAGTFNMEDPDDLHPYAPHLERALGGVAVVRHRGLPGWTAKSMLAYREDPEIGLSAILKRIENPKISLAILLAGTNDLSVRSNADEIFDSLVGLHSAAHALGIRTVAVGIPPSSWQVANAEAAAVAHAVNEKLSTWCSAQPHGLASFIPHPVSTYDNGGMWSSDGLHLSPQGYRVTGETLATVVKQLLMS